MESVVFKNLKHYPIGQANIVATDTSLTVNNFSESGLDGVYIDTRNNNTWHAKFNPVDLEGDASIRCVYIAEDGFGRTFTESEFIMRPSDSGEDKIIEIHSALFPEELKLKVLRNGEIVYQGDNPNPPSPNIWVVIGLYVLSHTSFKYITSTTTNSDGSSSTTTTKEFDWNSSRIKPAGGPEVEGDIFGVESSRRFESEDYSYNIVGVQIYCKNIQNFVITDETTSTEG